MLISYRTAIVATALIIAACPAFADEKANCSSGVMMMKNEMAAQPNASISNVLQNAINNANTAMANNDMPGCMAAVNMGMKADPALAGKRRACTSGIMGLKMAMKQPGQPSSIMQLSEAKIAEATTARDQGDVNGCMASVDAAMSQMPDVKAQMDSCNSGMTMLHQKMAAHPPASISDVLQAAIKNANQQMMKGDYAGCAATVTSAQQTAG